MRKDIVSIDTGARRRGYIHRYLLNSMAIMLSDAIVMALSLCVANYMLLVLRGIPFSISNGFLIVPVWLVVSMIARLLPGWGVGVVDELRRLEESLLILFAITLVVSYFARAELASSRIVFLFTYLLSAVLLPLGRAVARGIVIRMGMWGIPVSLYGDVNSAKIVMEALQSEKGMGYIPSAIFTDDAPSGTMIEGISVLGHLHNTTNRTPVAILALSEVSRHQLVETLEGPLEVYRRVIIIPDLKEAPSLWVVPRDLQGILGLEITSNLLNPFARFFKRFMDLLMAYGTLPVWLPLLAVIYILIWLEDRKNPLFLQKRKGRSGGMFCAVKFRTMVPDAEQVLEQALRNDPELREEWGKCFKLRKDPRITKVGNFLRRTSLDELPQLLNVLRGTMSIVGPRPLPAYHYHDLSEQVRFLRDKVKPGITGLWQVSGRSETGTEGMEKWDPYYVRNWSIWLDIVIIARTVKAVSCAHGAY